MTTRPPDPAFECDGSLRDVYILGVGVEDWRAALAYLAVRDSAMEFTLSGQPSALPSETVALFRYPPTANPELHVRLGTIDLVCHFFDETEIQLDLVPNEVRTTSQVEELRRFLQGLANAVGREVLLTPENCRKEPFWRISPVSAGRARP